MPRVNRAPAGLAELAAGQQRVLTRRQLAGLGVAPHQVRDHVRAGRWRVHGRHVVVLHNGPLTLEQRWWVAVLNAGDGAVLAGRTAAQAHGLTGFESSQIHVLVTRGARTPRADGVQIHESRRYATADRHSTRTPPVVRIERALIDAATWERSSRPACALLAAGVQQRLTTASRLLVELDRAGHVRHVQLLRLILGDIDGGAHSLAEIDFGVICRRAGLGAPLRQVVRLDAHGRRRYLDILVHCPNGGTFVVEVDGALHLLPDSYWDDQSRSNELVISGERILRFSTVVIRTDPAYVEDQLRRMARACPPGPALLPALL